MTNKQFNKIIFSTLLLILIGHTSLQAQSTLFVKKITGIQTSYDLININKITFSNENMAIYTSDESINNYAISEIQYLNFIDLANTINENDDNLNKISLYPNPVNEQFQIGFQADNNEIWQLDIIDIQGKTIQHQEVFCQKGNVNLILSAAQFPKGLFMCRLQNKSTLKTIKFIKN